MWASPRVPALGVGGTRPEAPLGPVVVVLSVFRGISILFPGGGGGGLHSLHARARRAHGVPEPGHQPRVRGLGSSCPAGGGGDVIAQGRHRGSVPEPLAAVLARAPAGRHPVRSPVSASLPRPCTAGPRPRPVSRETSSRTPTPPSQGLTAPSTRPGGPRGPHLSEAHRRLRLSHDRTRRPSSVGLPTWVSQGDQVAQAPDPHPQPPDRSPTSAPPTP